MQSITIHAAGPFTLNIGGSPGPEPLQLDRPPTADDIPSALGQIAQVTTTNELSGVPKTYVDDWVCMQLSPPAWGPPPHIHLDRNSNLYYRLYVLNGGPEVERAYL